MSVYISRAQLLLEQSRPADAEREAIRALSGKPRDGAALGLLTLSLVEQGKSERALETVEQAVEQVPNDPYIHYVHGITLYRFDCHDQARAAVEKSLQLQPDNEEALSLLAAIELARENWRAALNAAENALRLGPEHISATNFRAMALIRLNRRSEAAELIESALHRAPDNALSHTNRGWNELHGNDPRRAEDFFREALRLRPDLEYARRGLLETLRARHPVYRAILAYFLWMSRQTIWIQWAVVIGTYLVSRWVGFLLTAYPNRVIPIALALLLSSFLYLSWTAQPLFNFLLRFDRFGRHVLSRGERYGAYCFAVPLGAMLGCLIWWPFGGGELAAICVLLCGAISICVAAISNTEGGNRFILGCIAFALVVTATNGIYDLLYETGAQRTSELRLFFIGFIGFQIVANFFRRA